MTTDQKLRERDKKLKAELDAARAELSEARTERDEFKGKIADYQGPDDQLMSSDLWTSAQEATRKHGEIADRITEITNQREGLLQMMSGVGDAPANGNGTPQAHQLEEILRANGWDGHRLLAESDEFKVASERGVFTSNHPFGTVNIGHMCDRESFRRTILGASLGTAAAADVGTPSSAVPQDYRGIVQPFLGPLSILDVIPTGTTDSNVINYVQVTAVPGYAAETAELAAKPAEGLTLVDATAPVRTVAGYLKAARQALADLAGLASLINTLLPWDVRRRLQAQILAGDGSGQNLTGIYNTSGIGAPASAASDNLADATLKAITQVILSDADPSVLFVNPSDFLGFLSKKASGSGEYLPGPPGFMYNSFNRMTLWGLTAVMNRYVTAGSLGPLVLDPTSLILLVREGVNVRTSDSDQDDFIKNRVTILAETRVALPIWRPAGISKVPAFS